MPMSFFALHDLCPSDSFTKYGLLLIYGKLLRSGKDNLDLKYFIALQYKGIGYWLQTTL